MTPCLRATVDHGNLGRGLTPTSVTRGGTGDAINRSSIKITTRRLMFRGIKDSSRKQFVDSSQ